MTLHKNSGKHSISIPRDGLFAGKWLFTATLAEDPSRPWFLRMWGSATQSPLGGEQVRENIFSIALVTNSHVGAKGITVEAGPVKAGVWWIVSGPQRSVEE